MRAIPNSLRVYDLQVSACRLSIRRKAFSGNCPSGSYEHGEAEALWLEGQLHVMVREDRDAGERIGRNRIPARACLRVTKRTSEVDTAR